MSTAPTSLPELYKTAGQRCALRDLGLISQEEFEKEAWVTAALAAAPAVWSGAKWLGKKIFGGGKGAAGAARGAAGAAPGAARAAAPGMPGALRPPPMG
jgi:hypothetical protein